MGVVPEELNDACHRAVTYIPDDCPLPDDLPESNNEFDADNVDFRSDKVANHAAKRIERLEKFLAIPDLPESKGSDGWIPVTQRLPEDNEKVLTITEDGWYRIMTYGSTGCGFPSQVTHWQPLPAVPQEKGEK
jgi:hypothetical protein